MSQNLSSAAVVIGTLRVKTSYLVLPVVVVEELRGPLMAQRVVLMATVVQTCCVGVGCEPRVGDENTEG